MTLPIKDDGHAFFNKVRFNVFYVITKRVPIVPNLKRPSIKHLIKLIMYENDVKLLKFKRSPV